MSAPEALRKRVAGLDWYHTLELAPGLLTPGWFDTRGVPAQISFPISLEGKRCLDIGTFDGFWAFEMERRGAAEVIAVDVLDPSGWDWPAGSQEATSDTLNRRKRGGEGFVVAREALGSEVDRRELSVYDLDPERVGRFDFVYLGSLLLHLRDPVGALERVRSVCAGELMVLDAIDTSLSRFARRPLATLDGVGRPWWWKPNEAALARLVEAAGFEIVRGPERVNMPVGAGQPAPRIPIRALRKKAFREARALHRRGDPHAVVVAKVAQ